MRRQIGETGAMRKKPPRTVEDVAGPWQEPEFDSGLIHRCRDNWRVPVTDLSNAVLATFLRQGIALAIVAPEAERRITANIHDDSELYDDELASALKETDRD